MVPPGTTTAWSTRQQARISNEQRTTISATAVSSAVVSAFSR